MRASLPGSTCGRRSWKCLSDMPAGCGGGEKSAAKRSTTGFGACACAAKASATAHAVTANSFIIGPPPVVDSSEEEAYERLKDTGGRGSAFGVPECAAAGVGPNE